MRIVRDVFITAVLVLGAGTILIYGLGGEIPALRKVQPAPALAAAAPIPEPEPVKVTASDLIDAYDQNEIRADRDYGGKTLWILGEVGDISTDIMGTPFITLESESQLQFRSVQCFFKRSEKHVLADLNSGEWIVVSGRVDSLMMNVLVKDCALCDDNGQCR